LIIAKIEFIILVSIVIIQPSLFCVCVWERECVCVFVCVRLCVWVDVRSNFVCACFLFVCHWWILLLWSHHK